MQTFLYKLDQRLLFLALSMGFGVLLLLFRIQFTHSFFYTFLVWNLFLAGIPYGITLCMRLIPGLGNSRILSLLCFGAWLVFLPNSPYIITDLVHLHSSHSNLLWYDLFLVFVFAMNGLLLGLLSMTDMHAMLAKRFSERVGLFTLFKVSLLSGYGIYLGRFLRFNSWDLLTRPKTILLEMTQTIYEPRVWLMTFAFGGFIWILFLLLRALRQGVN